MINAVFNVVGEFRRTPNATINLLAVPRVGDTVEFPVIVESGETEVREQYVRTVVWQPFHHRGQRVYIVVGSPKANAPVKHPFPT